jgi:hypothetical protein
VTAGWFWSWQGFGFNVQSCFTPIISGAILLVVRACTREQRSSLCGAAFLCGVLAICDQRALVFIGLLVLPFLFAPRLRRWSVAGLVLVSVATIPALAAWYLWREGAWTDFIEQTLLFPLRHRNQGVHVGLRPWISSWLGTWLGGERVAVPLMLAGLVAAFLMESRRSLKAVWLMSVLCAAGYATLGGRSYPNYFLVFGPITLVLVSLLPSYVGGRWPALGKAAGASLIAFGVLCGLRPVLLFLGTGSFFLTPNEGTTNAAADYVRSHTSVQDSVLVWGFAPDIYVLSDRFRTFRDEGLLSIAGGNFASSSSNQPGLLPHMVREFDDFLTATAPRVIAVYGVVTEPCPGKGIILRNLDYHTNPDLKRLRDLIASSYRSELVLNGPCDRAELYALRDPSQR